MNPDILQMLLLNVGLPALVCTAVSWVAWRPSRKAEAKALPGYWGSVAGFAIGYAISHWFIVGGLPGLPYNPSWTPLQGVLYLAAIALGIGLVDSLWQLPVAVRGVLVALLTIAACWLMILPDEESVWQARGILSVSVIGSWFSLDIIAARRKGMLMPLLMVIVATGMSILLMFAASSKSSLLLGALAAMCGFNMVLSWLYRELSFARGTMLVIVVLLAAIMINGHLDNAYNTDGDIARGYIPLLCFLGVLVAPNMAWFGELPFMKKIPSWLTVIILAILVTIPVAISLAIAFSRWQTVQGGF